MESIPQFIPDLVGVVGVGFILGMYFLLQIGKIQSTDPVYSVGNATGSALLLISLFFDWNLSAVVLQCSWIAISIYGLLKANKTRFCKSTN